MADTPTFISGLRASNDFEANERPKNFREAILWLDPNGMSPLQALSAKMKTETTDDPEFSWWEEVMDAKRAVIASVSGGPPATTFVFAAGPSEANGVRAVNPARQFVVGDILQLYDASAGEATVYSDGTTGAELILVTGITNDTTITVQRGYGGRDLANVVVPVAGDRVMLVGKAFAEGSTSADSKFSQPVKLRNYTQIFKTSFQLTNTARATRYRTGDPWANDRKRAMFNHSEALEQAFLWGAPEEIVTGSEPVRLMGGLRHFLTSNVDVNVGAITDDFFLDTLAPLFDFNAGGAGDQRIVFLGNLALNAIQKAMRDSSPVRINYNGTVSFYGLKLMEYAVPQGTFYMKTHPLLNTDPIYSRSMFVLNGKGIIRRPLRGRDTKIQTEIQANDADLRKDQWLTEIGLELQFERTQGYFANIS